MTLAYRQINVLLFLASVVGMAFALYLQYYQHLDPCPLCIFQRIGLMGMGIFALIAAIHNPAKTLIRRSYTVLATLAIGWSTLVAGRHVWLQHLPPEDVPACGPGLDYWLDTFPLKDVVQKVLHGSGECAVVDWTFAGLSLPTLSLIFFSVLLLINLFLLIRPQHGLIAFTKH
ncbi:MAG: disulfide bond formation protein B [Moraxellaceae bacterium]|nr:MAG: disulfide bond formation protein B [Moraxellaceae bacterium]